ncbi:MAG TPA: hypothetical protein VFL70_03125 [Bacteroidia bacterium]|nr:hypothetical protein [Bacteroidia bacterium]
MAKQKRKSKIVELAQKRVAGMVSIDPNLDLGHGLTIASFNSAIRDVAVKLDAYNTSLSNADSALNEVIEKEDVLREVSERMLEAVGVAYGHNSNEYEKSGGVRKKDRKRAVRKTKKTAA